MQLTAGILERHDQAFAAITPNWPKLLIVSIFGWRNTPECHDATVEDVFKSYPPGGFTYGAERSGPLPTLRIH